MVTNRWTLAPCMYTESVWSLTDGASLTWPSSLENVCLIRKHALVEVHLLKVWLYTLSVINDKSYCLDDNIQTHILFSKYEQYDMMWFWCSIRPTLGDMEREASTQELIFLLIYRLPIHSDKGTKINNVNASGLHIEVEEQCHVAQECSYSDNWLNCVWR